MKKSLSESDISRVIEMAWEDRTTFDAIESQYGLKEQKVKELAERINKDYLGEELVIVGILKGAFIVISDIAKQLDVDVTFEFMSIQSYEGTKSTGQIKIDKDLDIDITGKNILIVEDIFDTGLTLSHLKNLLESRNPKSI